MSASTSSSAAASIACARRRSDTVVWAAVAAASGFTLDLARGPPRDAVVAAPELPGPGPPGREPRRPGHRERGHHRHLNVVCVFIIDVSEWNCDGLMNRASVVRPLLDRGLLPLAHLGRHHPHLEQELLRRDAAPHRVEVLLGNRRRTRRDVHEHALEIVEDRGHGRVARRRRGLPIQPIGRHELLGARTVPWRCRRRPSLSSGAHQLHQHHLRSIEMVAEVDEQDPLAHLLRRLRARRCRLAPSSASAGRP